MLVVKIADDPLSLAKGLMGVKKLSDNEGMLFRFPMITEASFWGKNTYIPLDIAFVDSNDKIISIKDIVPMSTKSVRSNGNCVMAIETNFGFFKNNGITEGDSIVISLNDDATANISFIKNV